MGASIAGPAYALYGYSGLAIEHNACDSLLKINGITLIVAIQNSIKPELAVAVVPGDVAAEGCEGTKISAEVDERAYGDVARIYIESDS